MLKALIIQHIACEGPGRLAPILEQRGFSIDRCLAYAGHTVPTTLSHDLLIIMGGPMSVSDIGSERFPFLAQEITLLQSVIAKNQAMIGICLGAQLLAHAAGARVYPNLINNTPCLEVGWGAVNFHNVQHHPALAGLPSTAVMLHWHGDTFDLPPHAKLLASTPSCAHQLFCLSRQYGIQFHPEVEDAIISEWTTLDHKYVAKANGPDGALRITNDTARYSEPHRIVGDRLLDNIICHII